MPTDTAATDPLIFPIGHYAGAFYRPGSPGREHHVLVGTETVRISDQQLRVWLTARGLPDEGDNQRWTRGAVEALARRAGTDDISRILEELSELGLVVETIPGTERAIDFAEAYRVAPLLLGLGNTPDEPWLYGIGLFDQPFITVSAQIYGLWEWAHVDHNLWAACYAHVDVAKRAGATAPEETDPERILTGFLNVLHPLLATGATYLDVALVDSADHESPQPVITRPDDAGTALVFPIGHYVGAFYPHEDAPLKYRNLRVGVEIERLTDEHEFAVWALAHGFPDRTVEADWTRDAMLEAAEDTGIPDPATVLDRLVARGLVAQVHPDRPEAVEFAVRHRMQPLLHGLGNTLDDPKRFGIGLIGVTPPVNVDGFGYRIWQWARMAPSLWAASEVFVAVPERAGEAELQQTLARMLRALQRLLAGNAAYLDVSPARS